MNRNNLDGDTLDKIFVYYVQKFPKKDWEQQFHFLEYLDGDTRQQILGFLKRKRASQYEVLNDISVERASLLAQRAISQNERSDLLSRLVNKENKCQVEREFCKFLIEELENS
jgi:hypothetical protein